LAIAGQAGKPADLAERLKAVLDFGLRAECVSRLYRRYFYRAVRGEDAARTEMLLQTGDRLMEGLKSEDEKTKLRQMLLDAAFLAEDYRRALKILEQGIPEYDKQWHDMAIVKVKAHLAMKEGKKAEAIEHLRTFMEYVATWDKPARDPASGVPHTKEMTLGRNAKRIGDIYKSMGDTEGAAKAYEEAGGYYEKSLLELPAGSPEWQVLKNDLEALMAARAGGE
jgi:tetratricopeptide (TPR) repeat protein